MIDSWALLTIALAGVWVGPQYHDTDHYCADTMQPAQDHSGLTRDIIASLL